MRRTIVTIGIAALALTTFTACGGGSSAKLPGNLGTIPSGGGLDTIPSDGGDMGSGEMSQECLDFAMAYASALGSAAGAGSGSEGDWQSWVSGMQAAVPDELKDDVAVWAGAMQEYLTVLEAHPNDYLAPEVMAASEKLATPEVTAASDAISAYFDNGCQL
jgi:hypothetical protein